MSLSRYNVSTFLYSWEQSIIGRQRLVFFIAVGAMSILLTISSFFLQPKSPTLTVIDITTVLLTILLGILYFGKKINIRLATTSLFILLQLELSAQKITFATINTPESNALILQASFLSLLLITISLVCFLRYSPTIISVISIFTYVLCLTMDQSSILETFLPVYMVVLIGAIIYDIFSVHAALNLEAENQNLRQEMSIFFYETGLSSDSIKAISQLAREKGKAEGMREILSQMDPGVRARLVSGLSAIHQEDESSRKDIAAAFPMLTPTQITICQLILQDMKLSEICRVTGKSEGNITSQRSRIRSILELNNDEVLKDALQERLNAYRETVK